MKTKPRHLHIHGSPCPNCNASKGGVMVLETHDREQYNRKYHYECSRCREVKDVEIEAAGY